LYCHNNNLSILPEIPNTLTQLWCCYNNIYSFPDLSNSLINIQHFCNPICIYINTYFDGDTKKYFEHHKKTKKQFINKIENWFLDCKYNPKYKYCRKRLMKEYDDLYN